MNRSIRHAFATFLVLAPAIIRAASLSCPTPVVPPSSGLVGVAPATHLRTPHGIYADVNVNEYLKDNPCTDFSSVFQGLLNNPAVSGIVLYETWARLNPNAPTDPSPYDWSIVNELFNQVLKWNTANPASPKTVQLVPTPGFNSPQWLLDQIYSCNYLFDSVYLIPKGKTCGKATLSGFVEGGVDHGTPIPMDLPMPWDLTYKSAWQTFLSALAKRYGSRPELVSIAVAGPTASSEEMMLPTTKLTTGPQINSLTPEDMWNLLLKNHYSGAAYQQTDQAFIDEWEHAIDMYGKTFNSITLTISTGNGLPDLGGTFAFPVDLTVPFAMVCPVADMDCAAETTILSYFRQSTVGGSNAKATQTDGMKGAGTTGNLGVPGVKLISQSTDTFTSPSKRILGGAQFGKKFSQNSEDEGGCTSSMWAPLLMSTMTTCSPEQALNEVLTWFFKGTLAGAGFSGNIADNGPAPLNYVQIYGPDITYATTAYTAGKVKVAMADGATYMTTAQDLLNSAAFLLTLIGEY
jgi:hypothetical protein